MTTASAARRDPIDWPATIADVLLGGISGVLVGMLGTIQHQNTVQIAGVALPYGITMGLLAVLAMTVGFRLLRDGRLMAIAATLGMTAVVLAASGLGPGGSVLVPGNTLGMVWGYVPPLLCALVILWPRLRFAQRA